MRKNRGRLPSRPPTASAASLDISPGRSNFRTEIRHPAVPQTETGIIPDITLRPRPQSPEVGTPTPGATCNMARRVCVPSLRSSQVFTDSGLSAISATYGLRDPDRYSRQAVLRSARSKTAPTRRRPERLTFQELKNGFVSRLTIISLATSKGDIFRLPVA